MTDIEEFSTSFDFALGINEKNQCMKGNTEFVSNMIISCVVCTNLFEMNVP